MKFHYNIAGELIKKSYGIIPENMATQIEKILKLKPVCVDNLVDDEENNSSLSNQFCVDISSSDNKKNTDLSISYYHFGKKGDSFNESVYIDTNFVKESNDCLNVKTTAFIYSPIEGMYLVRTDEQETKIQFYDSESIVFWKRMFPSGNRKTFLSDMKRLNIKPTAIVSNCNKNAIQTIMDSIHNSDVFSDVVAIDIVNRERR